VRPFVGAAALPSFLFTDLRAEQGDLAELTLGPAIGAEGAARLTLTRRADGTSKRVQGRALTPVQADDTAPPITTVTITGGTVRVEADDGPGGSGVYRTILSLDGFRHDQYDRPLPIPDDVALVMAYSEDNAGNREYPGWVKGALGVSATDVRVDRDGPEHFVTVDVVNLDPLGISGPIPWQALANAPWVQVDPARGTTPQRLRVSVDASQLPQGASEATSEVVITVLDEQPVVPARRVTVTVTAG
jgi:hypothetical protein